MSESLTRPNPSGTRYSEEEVGKGLAAVAYFNGNTRRAAKALAARGTNIPRGTLRGWLDNKQDEYERLRREVLPRINERIAEDHMALADDEMRLAREMITDLREKKGSLAPRDISTAIRNLDVGSGIHTRKSQELREGIAAPTRQLDMVEIGRRFKAAGVSRVLVEMTDEKPEAVESTAQEVSDGESAEVD